MGTWLGSFLLGLVVAGAAAAAVGCDDLTLGRPRDPGGPARLVKVLVQDSTFVGGPPAQRAGIVDLLDHEPPPACSDLNPCVNQFLIAQTLPRLDCSAANGGTCVDPLRVPATGVPLNAGHTNLRLVFDRLFDATVEAVRVDANGAPQGGAPYRLAPGIVELFGPDGRPVPDTTAYYDNTGSPQFTSDVIWIPFGPAIVINPGRLDPSSKYTLRLHPAALRDRKGEGVAGKDGAPLTDPTDYSFTTEPITPHPDRSYPDFSKPAKIAPNQVLQLAFWEFLDEATVVVSASGPAGFQAAAVEAFADRGADRSACAAARDDALFDLVYTTGAGAARRPTKWPVGDYTLIFTVKDASGRATYRSPKLAFVVGGGDTDPAHDPHALSQHVTPEQCQ